MNEFKLFFAKCVNMLKDVSSENSKHEIELIFCEVLKLNKGKLKLQQNIKNKQKRRVLKLIKKRKKGYPLQYLFQKVEFLNLKLKVNKNVLIPRNETEQLADLVIKDLQKVKDKEKLSVLDLACGSGCIGLSIAKNVKTFVTLSDISKKALKVAKQNAKLNIIRNVKFKQSNLFDKVSKKYHIFVCNPPYIKTKDLQTLEAQVKDFEPILALDGGEDGCNFYRQIIEKLPEYLFEEAVVYFEMGINQVEDIKKLLRHYNFENIEAIKDYYNIERIIKAQFFKKDKEERI